MFTALEWTVRYLPNVLVYLVTMISRKILFSLGMKEYKREMYLVKAVQGAAKSGNIRYQTNSYGEDAWCIAGTPQCEVLAVADGVGSWRLMGIDAGIFANQMMRWCANYAERAQFKPYDPRSLLISSYMEIMGQKGPIRGGCTACIVAFDRQNSTLYSANLGDSGFMVVRNGKILYRSEEQLHGFNTPFQLTVPPDNNRMLVHCDKPEEAQTQRMPVQPGDVILVATDGLFDNVADHDLATFLKYLEFNRDPVALQNAANVLVSSARNLSTRSQYLSPFARKAKEYNIKRSIGGKPDDITVILAIVAERKV